MSEGTDDIEIAYEVCRELVGKIEHTKATTREGLRIKARAVLWCHNNETIELSDHQTTDIRIAQSILYDLL